jgi:hypothetical protein
MFVSSDDGIPFIIVVFPGFHLVKFFFHGLPVVINPFQTPNFTIFYDLDPVIEKSKRDKVAFGRCVTIVLLNASALAFTYLS